MGIKWFDCTEEGCGFPAEVVSEFYTLVSTPDEGDQLCLGITLRCPVDHEDSLVLESVRVNLPDPE